MPAHHGFETVTTNDQRAWLWVVSILSLVYSLLCMGARLTGKWELLYNDDGILGAAYLLAIAHYATLFKAISAGLGASPSVVSSSQMMVAAKFYFISRILGFSGLCLSKLSVIAFTRRIFSGNIYGENLCFVAAYVSSCLYGICGILLSSAGCGPKKSLVPRVDAVCDANIARWTIITTLDVATEISLLALPIRFISKNQIKASKKRAVIFVFSFRLLVAAFSIAVTATYFTFLHGSETSMGLGPTVAWQETLLGYSLISASIPGLRSFLFSFMSTGLMTAYGHIVNAGGSHRGVETVGSQSSQDQTVVRSQNNEDPLTPGSFGVRLRPEALEYKVAVQSQQQQSKSGQNICKSDSIKSDEVVRS